MAHAKALVTLTLLSILANTDSHTVNKRGEHVEKSLTMEMPGAKPKGHDSYLCKAFRTSDLIGAEGGKQAIYVTKFEPVNAVADRAHHMILRSCVNPPKKVRVFKFLMDFPFLCILEEKKYRSARLPLDARAHSITLQHLHFFSPDLQK